MFLKSSSIKSSSYSEDETPILNLIPFLTRVVFYIRTSHLKHWTEVDSDNEDVLHDKMVNWHRENLLKSHAAKCHLQLRQYSENAINIT